MNSKNSKSSTPLHLDTSENHSEVTELLLERGADVNSINDSLGTPPHVVEKGCLGVAKQLLEKGANISVIISVS